MDKEVAEWFANRYSQNGLVYRANINKSDILFYTNDRNESEVVVNYKKLYNIEEV